MTNLKNEPDLGYIFYPYEDIVGHPGCSRMDVILREEPTLRHFDPSEAIFRVASASRTIEQVYIRHPWTIRDRYHVCAGKVFVKDRKPKTVEAFSFGGDLQILAEADQTLCILQSRAPIFPLIATNDLSMWMATEVEIVLARQKAHWDPKHPHNFENHLATLDPFLLYTCCLQSVEKQMTRRPFRESMVLEKEGLNFVRSEIRRLKMSDQWTLQPPTPDQLFCVEG